MLDRWKLQKRAVAPVEAPSVRVSCDGVERTEDVLRSIRRDFSGCRLEDSLPVHTLQDATTSQHSL